LILGLAFTLPGALCLAGCSRRPAPPEEKSHPPAPQQVLQDLRLRQSSLKGLLWVLDAKQGTSYGPNEPIQLTSMTVRFYDGGTEVRSVLTSRRGIVDDKSQTLIARDSVVVVTPKGERLETDSLRWDPKNAQIATKSAFRFLRGEDYLVTGTGFRADPDLTHYTIESEVRAEVRGEEDSNVLEAVDGDKERKR
jgi:LPS export ABC transporter protein LptC